MNRALQNTIPKRVNDLTDKRERKHSMRKLLQQALDALQGVLDAKVGQAAQFWSCSGGGFEAIECDQAIHALRAELSKPEPVPYGWTVSGTSHIYTHSLAFAAADADAKRAGGTAIPLYTAPTEPNCKFPTCHSQEYQDKLVQEILGQEPEPVAYMLTTRIFGLGGETWDTTEYRDHQWDCDCVPLYTKGNQNV